MATAFIDEVFASIQGEGPWVGQRHVFIRFIGCDLRCGYCDTPAAKEAPDDRETLSCRAQTSLDSLDRQQLRNPVSAAELTALCVRLGIPGPARPIASLTGGEPLLHLDFLMAWLPDIRRTFDIFLETSGIHHTALQSVKHFIDIVSMDIKLPSSTGQRARWDENRMFLAAASGRRCAVKAVVTKDTLGEDLVTAARLVAEADRSIPFVIQPASGRLAPPTQQLIRLQNTALGILEDVRIIPQVQRMLQVP
jgi:organic radical activating enzyme